MKEELAKYLNTRDCPDCHGTRLRREARHILVADRNIHELSAMPLKEAQPFFEHLELPGAKKAIAEKIVREHPNARIVMVSSVGYQENIVAALQRGARHFVQKPVKPEVLYEVIKYVMRDDGAAARSAGAGA